MQLKNKMKKVIITEEQLGYFKDNKAYVENNSSEIFNKEVRKFIYNIIKGNIGDISDYWRINGIKKSKLFRILSSNNIIKDTDDGILVPKRNFDKKVDRVYYGLFGDQEPGLIMTEDDGGGDASAGATTASNSGSYEVPLFGQPIRRKIANT